MIRPCDANETVVAWQVAVETRDRPVALILSRQTLPVLARGNQPALGGLAFAEGLRRGAYVLSEAIGIPTGGGPDLILIASGSEVTLSLAAQERLLQQGVRARVVSMPSWELFDNQSPEYQASVFPASVSARVAVEAGASQGWHRYVGSQGAVISVDRFGASAPGDVVMREYGFTAEAVIDKSLDVLQNCRTSWAPPVM